MNKTIEALLHPYAMVATAIQYAKNLENIEDSNQGLQYIFKYCTEKKDWTHVTEISEIFKKREKVSEHLAQIERYVKEGEISEAQKESQSLRELSK